MFDAYPVAYDVLKVVSVVYLLYLAWKIATAAAPEGDSSASGKPFTFLQAAAFQWVNPKAWTMALTAVSLYSPDRELQSIAIIALVFGAINVPSISVWTVMGQQLRRLLTSTTRLRAFNASMAVLLVGSLYPVLLPG